MFQAQAVGNLIADAELKKVGDSSVCKFAIAINRYAGKDEKGEGKEHTDILNCDLWGKRGEALAPHLTKGGRVAVNGEMRTSQAEKDGKKITYYNLNVDGVELLGGKKKEEKDE